jgi:molybdate-binding protein/transcriptional regulator with XRE-family HTH domain
MAKRTFRNRVREERGLRGWSQDELAQRSRLSRAEVSAVETGRVVPSTAAALALAGALRIGVEDLFALDRGGRGEPGAWAWPPGRERRYWLAAAGDRVLRYPVESTSIGTLAHDGVVGVPANRRVDSGVATRGRSSERASAGSLWTDPQRTLVVAGCDPAIGLLEGVLRRSGIRLLPLIRSSRRALDLLARGLVHVAGVHLGDDEAGNAEVVDAVLGRGYRRVHVARWTEGVALSPGLAHRTIPSAVRAGLRWVGREEGSGARRCLDLILEGRSVRPDGYANTASDHRGVVETIRTGWAQAGVCVQLAAEEGGLAFLPARHEDYDFCFAEGMTDDARLVALLDALRTRAFARVLGDLPGYDTRHTGALS